MCLQDAEMCQKNPISIIFVKKEVKLQNIQIKLVLDINWDS